MTTLNVEDKVRLTKDGATHLGELHHWEAGKTYIVTSVVGECVSSLDNIRCMLAFSRFRRIRKAK